MKLLYYNDLNYKPVERQFSKIAKYLEAGDFKSADVKKMPQSGYYRAKLDKENRLLFTIGEYQGEKYLFLLEVILNHDYDKSRFLGGAAIDESKLLPVPSAQQVAKEEVLPMPYVNESDRHFHLLDKILSFDEQQRAIFNTPPPIIIIGSAGSGKTALTLEKLKSLNGQVLYITLSAYLVENASRLYYSFGYDNNRQEVDFLSFADYLGGIDLPKGKEISFRDFDRWIWRYQQAYKIKDTYKIFEEFKGVLTGSVTDKPYLSKADYLGLGVRQSIFSQSEREKVYDLFVKYLDFLGEGDFYDSNIAAYERLEKVAPAYDFVVVDEVQDITNVQLSLILSSLKQPQHFILCGDSNQIVHPNFFSWTNVKTLFYQQDLKGQLTRILYANYRNTPEVTHIANQLLRVKNARFGSIDKESTFLVKATSANRGEVTFFQDKPNVKKDLDKRTSRSARFAVLVMRNEDKASARKFFRTPLLFSVQEAKGLEYENIILYNFITDNEAAFRELCRGVDKTDLTGELKYARAKDKGDKSLDEYKFYVNSLYVAITRAVKNLYVIEAARKHELLQLLDLVDFKDQVQVKDQSSSDEEWQQEARRLELQGKKEQADDIRKQILNIQEVPWEVITRDRFEQLKKDALDPEVYNKKAKDTLFEYALIYHEHHLFDPLIELKYRKAEGWERESLDQGRISRKFPHYFQDKVKNVESELRKYGLDFRNPFNFTPLMMSVLGGSVSIVHYLIELGADTKLRDNLGRQAFHTALLRAYQDRDYALGTLPKLFKPLQPESTLVKFGNRSIKLSSHQMEFFVLNIMIALLREVVLSRPLGQWPAFESADFLEAVSDYPSQMMADYRKRRPYISSILAKNEVLRDDPYNRKLLLRVKRGAYIINPLIEIQEQGQWRNIYEVACLEDMGEHAHPRLKAFGDWVREQRQALMSELAVQEKGE